MIGRLLNYEKNVIFKKCKDIILIVILCPYIFGMGTMEFVSWEMGLGQAEQSCTLCVHMSSSLYSTGSAFVL